jgi:heat-inducible transcriptional repressor
MTDLEKMGFLEQPHTSAGRVPTSRGYRIYVNSLMEEYHLSFEETLILNSLLASVGRETGQVMEDMANILSKMTGYAVVAFATERCGTVERFEGVYINPKSFLLVLITSEGKAITKTLQVDLPLSAKGVTFIIDTLNDHLAKKELGGLTLERLLAMEKELGSYRGIAGVLLQSIYEVVARMGKEEIAVKGMSNLLQFPEFSEGDAAVSLVRELENHESLLDRFRQDWATGLRVHIASEEDGLAGASYVICPFRLGHGPEGTVCIIGPKRMNYTKAMARLEYLAKKINAVSGFEPTLPLIEETKEG